MFSVFFVIKNIVAIPVFLIWTIYTSRYDLPLQTLLLFLFYPSVLKHRPACTARACLLIRNGLAYIHAFFAPKNTGREPETAVPSSARLIIKYPDYLLLPLFYTSIYKTNGSGNRALLFVKQQSPRFMKSPRGCSTHHNHRRSSTSLHFQFYSHLQIEYYVYREDHGAANPFLCQNCPH